MNKTQKASLVCLLTGLLSLCIFTYIIVKIFIYKSLPSQTLASKAIMAVIYLIFITASVFILRTRQSPKEVESDERDERIKSKAAIAGFVSFGLLLAGECLVLQFTVGYDGQLPAFLVPLINISIFLLSLSVYSVSVLIQYNRGHSDGG